MSALGFYRGWCGIAQQQAGGNRASAACPISPESGDGSPVTTGAVIAMFSAASPPATLFAGLPKTPIYCFKEGVSEKEGGEGGGCYLLC